MNPISLSLLSSFALRTVLVLLGLTVTGAQAADLFYDADGATTAAVGGTGNWTGGSTWRAGSSTGTLQAWADGNSANFPANSTITLNGNVATSTITNTSTAGLIQIVGSGANAIDFGAGGFFVSPGNGSPSLRSSAKLKGVVTFFASSGALNTTAAIWLKADNTGLTSVTCSGIAGGSMIVDDAGVFGPAATSTLLITNGVCVNLGAQASEIIGTTAGAGVGLNVNAVPTTLGGGYIRPRFGASTWNGAITLTAAGSGFTTRGSAGVGLTLASTATVNLNANTLNLNVDATGNGLALNGVISGSGGIATIAAPITGSSTGTGTTTLGAANTFNGVALTTQNLGTLALNNVNALQNATLDTGVSGSQAVTFIVAGNNTYNLGALQGSDALAIGGNTISVGTKTVDTTFSAIISGSGGKLTKVGVNKLTLATSPTYDGLTTISAGTLALNNGIALAAASGVSLAASGTLDVSANATYTWGASASLTASGTGTTAGSTAAEIKGGTTVNLGSRPVTLNFAPTSFSGDSTHPALYISSGALTINGSITVSNASGTALGEGTNTLIKQASGTISGTPTLSGTVGGSGIASGKTAFIQVSGGEVQLVVQGALPSTTTLTRHTGTGASTTYGDTLQFDVTVSGSGPTPTGTVELRDGGVGGTVIGSGSLSGGSVTITPAVNALSATTHANIVALYLGDSTYQSSSTAALSPAQSIATKALTVSGATATSKFYDTTTAATITGGSLVGVVSGDAGIVTLVQSGNFVTAGPGSAISVTGTCSLTGSAAGNYSLTQPAGLVADIIAAAIWTNTVSGAWSTNANWTNNLVGTGANVTADFSQVDLTADLIVTNNVNRTIGNLIFGDADNSTAAGWFVTNNTLTLAGTTPTVTVNALGTDKQVTINSVVAGTSGLTKKGPGTLTLAGANTFTGSTVVSNGVINFNADSGFGFSPVSATPGNIVLDGGGIALTTGNQTVAANRGFIIGANGGTISNAVPNAGNLSVSGVITGPGSLTIGSAANAGVILSAQNTYSGGSILNGPASVTIFNVSSTVGSPGSLVSGPFGTNTVTFNGPGMRSTTGADTTNGNAIVAAADITFPSIGSEKTLTWEGPVTLSGGSRTFTVSIGATVAGKSLTVNSVIGDGGSGYALTKAGSGTLVLSAANTFSGGVTNSGGILTVNNNGALGTNALTISSGATRVVVNDGFTVTNNITINGGGASLRGLIENSGTGNATLTNGVITINSTTSGGGHFASAAGGTLTIADPINSSVSVSLRTGTAIFSGGGSYADMSITGTGRLGANNGLSTSATVDLGLSGGATFDLAGYNQSLAGMKRTVVNSAIVTNSSTTSDSTLTLTGASTFPGSINDSGVAGSRIALAVSGGSHTLSGTSLYSGNTAVSGGTLALSGSGSIANTPKISVGAGATFDVSGLSSAFTLGAAQTLTNSGSTALLAGNANSGSGTVSMSFASGTPAFNVTNGTLTLSASTVFKVNNTGAALGVGSYKLIGKLTGGAVAGTLPSVTVSGGGAASVVALQINSGELYLNVIAPTLALASSAPTNGYLDSVNFTAAVQTNGVTAGNASGSVTFSANGTPFSTNGLSSGSAASSSLNTLPRGTNLITAVYPGDVNYSGNTNTFNQIVTNHPPIAVDATYYRAKGLSLKIALTNLLTNVTDADGDPNSLQSVGAGLTNATIMTDSTYVYYLPGTGAGSNDNDVISYTVSDGFGGTAMANILVTVYSAAGPAQMSLPTNGVVNITFFGIPNYTYVVQTTTNLSVPWWTLSTNTASTNGSWQFTDPNATNAQQYYRSSQP